MLRRGCTLLVVLFGALFALYFFFFTRYFEWPGNLFAAGLGSLFGAMGLAALGNLLWAWRDTAAFRRAARKQPLADGTLVVVAGHIRPLGAPLTSPFGGRPCVAYEYEVVQQLPSATGRRRPRAPTSPGSRWRPRRSTRQTPASGCSGFRSSTSSRNRATPGPTWRRAPGSMPAPRRSRRCAASARSRCSRRSTTPSRTRTARCARTSA